MTVTSMDSLENESALPFDLSACRLRLPSYEGPLDLLLRLIERNQLPIAQVSLVEVTDQFLAQLDELDAAPPAVMAEFAAVGARLTLLKSRALLPQPADVVEETEPDDLVIQLLEYQAFRALAQFLADRAAGDLTTFGRPAIGESLTLEPTEFRLPTMTPDVLARSLRRRLSLLPKRRIVLDVPSIVTLREMIQLITMRLRRRRQVLFSSIVVECRDRREVQTAFLALLVLVRRRRVDAWQKELFGEIALRPTMPRGEFVQGLDEDAALGLTADDPVVEVV